MITSRERRSLLLEMISVIAGVLIALFVDQIAGDWRDQRRADEFRAMLREEIRFNSQWYAYRVAVAPCVERRLSIIEDHVEALASRKPVPRLPLSPIILGGRLDDQAWDALQSSGSLSDFSPADQKMYSGIYSQQRDIREWQRGEGEDWVTLTLAAKRPETLTASDITELRIAIASAQRWAVLQLNNGRGQIRRVKQLGIQPPARDPRDERQAAIARRSSEMCAAVGVDAQWPEGFAPAVPSRAV